MAVTRAKKERVLSWSGSILSGDTHENNIVRGDIVRPIRRGGIYLKMTRSTLLPPSITPPTPGAEWIEDEVAKPVQRKAPKVGRNDLCPCGSGKKYKKCHGTAA